MLDMQTTTMHWPLMVLGILSTGLVLAGKQDGNVLHASQVHVSLGATPSEMVVMWSSRENTTSVVKYGTTLKKRDMVATGKFTIFSEGNENGTQFIHRVKLTNLLPGRTYFYSTGKRRSAIYSFHTLSESEAFSPELLVYGDLGAQSESFTQLVKAVSRGRYSAVLHVGDIAYDLHSNAGQVGDTFMSEIQPIAACVPYMTCPGDHEAYDEFRHYRNRFSMPVVDWPMPLERLWYSFDVGKAHIISYSTEVFFTSTNHSNLQRAWLEEDLVAANTARGSQPWIIAFGHRPMYCSNNGSDDCTREMSVVRRGLEDLFYKHGVDLILNSHQHAYERMWPVYRGEVTSRDYDDPTAPIHITSGSVGNMGNDAFGTPGSWSAFGNTDDASYGSLKIINETHMYWTQHLLESGKILDETYIIQHNHGPFVGVLGQGTTLRSEINITTMQVSTEHSLATSGGELTTTAPSIAENLHNNATSNSTGNVTEIASTVREEEEYEYDDDDDDDEYYDEDSSEEYDENYDENSEDDSEENSDSDYDEENSSESEEDAYNVTHTKSVVSKITKQRPTKYRKNNTIIIHIRSSRSRSITIPIIVFIILGALAGVTALLTWCRYKLTFIHRWKQHDRASPYEQLRPEDSEVEYYGSNFTSVSSLPTLPGNTRV